MGHPLMTVGQDLKLRVRHPPKNTSEAILDSLARPGMPSRVRPVRFVTTAAAEMEQLWLSVPVDRL